MRKLYLLLFALLAFSAINAQTWEWSNPAKDQITVDAPGTTGAGTFVLTNTHGQELIRKKIEGSVSHMDIRHLISGVYFVQVAYAHGLYAGKIIKE